MASSAAVRVHQMPVCCLWQLSGLNRKRSHPLPASPWHREQQPSRWRGGEAGRSGNLFENMPDQPFLSLVDVFEQRGLVHAHLLSQFTGVDPPGMLEKPGPV